MEQAIASYYAALDSFSGLGVTRETSVRSAMQYLLDAVGQEAGWKLTPEHHLANGKIPDGTFLDEFKIAHGYWEAKDTKDDLQTEIDKKFKIGYPPDNIIFEDTRRAVLFQGRTNRYDYDLTKPDELRALLRQFSTYQKPHFENFKRAVNEFAAELPKLALGIKTRIESERDKNPAFTAAFATFHELCIKALNPQISVDTIEEMLVQHLLTERLFRTIFENPDFTRRNVIAAEIEKVIDALTRRAFNRADFLKSLDRFYVPIETEGRSITEWNDKQEFLNKVYERFFQGFSTKQADTYGVVYTPQPIVNFMLASVEHILKTEFGSSLSDPGVDVLDPCTGTANYIVNLMRHHISRRDLARKYASELFANEIMLLPYYIASLNIEHAYYELMGEYLPFTGLCFADTLALAEGQQLAMFAEENSERTQREQDAPITVIVGNPPYNVGQKNENENNKNLRYKVVDKRIGETYAKSSKATLNIQLYDAYVKFFRWATDRLNGRDGIVAFVSNNSFLNKLAFDGMRKHLTDDYTTIYHLDCGGDVRKNPKLSGTTHNVFGIQVGVGITILVRRQVEAGEKRLFYHALPPLARASEKLKALIAWSSVENVDWSELTPDAKQNWLTEGMQADFETFLPLGTKEAKASKGNAIFSQYSMGVNSSRDAYVYSFDKARLKDRAKQFVDLHNMTVDKYKRLDKPERLAFVVDVNDNRIKWSRQTKALLGRLQYSTFTDSHLRRCLYRPFTKKVMYFDEFWNEERYKQHLIFPVPTSEEENISIVVSDRGHRGAFSTFATNCIPEYHLMASTDAVQCFPFYVYDEDGTNQRENITDWALQQFQAAHGADVTKWDIFHYVYALLHSPAYREKYAENLKRELPRIPATPNETPGAFRRYVAAGEQLLKLHRDYEDAAEYRLQAIENRDVSYTWRVEKMRLSKDKTQVVVNESLTLAGIPPETFAYRLGNRSALEWVLDQYQVTTDKRSGIVSDPNREQDHDYIVRLIGKVITVSLETVRLVKELS